MKRLLLVGAIAVAGSLMLASAAAIDFGPGGAGAVGAGTSSVGGFDVTDVTYELDANGNTVGVNFTIAPTAPSTAQATTVDVHTDLTTFADWSCTVVAGAVDCDTSVVGGVDTETIDNLTVVASS